MARYQLKEYDEAISSLREGFREVRDFSGQLTLADALDEKGESAQALEEYRKALFLNPGDGRAMNNFGVCLSRQGKDAEALAVWERAAGLKTPNLDSLANLAVMHYGRGDFTAAKKWAELTLSSGASGDDEKKARRVLERLLAR
jgi:Tfp pilus assembly protein PilF